MDDPQRQEAFVSLLTDAQPAIRLYVASLMAGCPDVDDVVQETNTLLWRKREEFEPGTPFKAWAFSVARYQVLNWRKRQAKAAETP